MIKTIQFGKFHLPMSQTFLIRDHVFATVNIKPFLPGHILVCPRRVVPKLQDMTAQEIKQLFLTCQEVAKVLEKVYNSPYNLSMQNGKQAGQTVPHVHMHLCPIAMKGMKKRQENCMKRSEEDMAEQAARYRIYF